MNKKTIFIIIGAVVLVAIVACILFFFMGTKKLTCKSSQGNITLRYSKDNIVGYTAKNINYDLDGQQKIAEKIGVDAYLEQFKQWFANNTDGTCK